MVRGARWYLVGSLILLALGGCGRSWFAEREPWRREAEEQCLKSGAVREGPAVALIKPITGPGVCGADYPLRVAALGETTALGYDDEALRPPGVIPAGAPGSAGAGYPARVYPGAGVPRVPVNATPIPAPPFPAGLPPAGSPAAAGPPAAGPRYAPYPQQASPGPPIPLNPPGTEADDEDAPALNDGPPPTFGAPSAYPRPSPAPPYDARPLGVPRPVGPAASGPAAQVPAASMPAVQVPLSPSRAAPFATGAVAAAVTPAATLACPLVSVLDQWVSGAVQPAAQKWFGQPVVEIKQISAYSCRGMNGNPNAHISEHAFGNALDIAAFTFADGRRVSVKDGWHGAPEEQGFLRDVEAAACAQFSTVLAPGSNVYHYDHIHVDLMRRASGRRICNPAAMEGEVAAARARSRYGSRPVESGVTGSIGQAAPAPAPLGYEAEPADVDDDRPHALPRRDY